MSLTTEMTKPSPTDATHLGSGAVRGSVRFHQTCVYVSTYTFRACLQETKLSCTPFLRRNPCTLFLLLWLLSAMPASCGDQVTQLGHKVPCFGAAGVSSGLEICVCDSHIKRKCLSQLRHDFRITARGL